jgi:hypothetical protein
MTLHSYSTWNEGEAQAMGYFGSQDVEVALVCCAWKVAAVAQVLLLERIASSKSKEIFENITVLGILHPSSRDRGI